MRHAFAFALLTLATAASAQTRPPANPYNDRLRALAPDIRHATLRRAIAENGNRCGRVTAADWRGPYRNLQRWTVQCTPTGRFGVYIGTDGSVQARACATTKQLRLPDC